MKLFKWENIPEGCRFPHHVLVSMGWVAKGSAWQQFYIQFQSPEKVWGTEKDWMLNKDITGWRRKAFRIILRWNFYNMTDE